MIKANIPVIDLKEGEREYGWEKIKHEWNPPRIIGQESKDVEIPIPP